MTMSYKALMSYKVTKCNMECYVIMKKRNIKALLQIVFTVVLLTYILLNSNIGNIIGYLSKAPFYIWVALVLVSTFEVLVSAVRLHLFFPEYKFSVLLITRLIISTYAFVLPGQIAVEGVKAYMLGKDNKSYDKSGAAVFVDKVIGFIALLALGVIGAILSAAELGMNMAFLFIGITIILVGALFLVNIAVFFNLVTVTCEKLEKKTGKFGAFFRFISGIIKHWHEYANDRSLLIKNFIYGILYQALIALSGAVICFGIGEGFNFLNWLWINAILSAVLLIPISFGGIGVREGTLIGLMTIIGIGREQALAVSFSLLGLSIAQALAGIPAKIYAAGRDFQTPQ